MKKRIGMILVVTLCAGVISFGVGSVFASAQFGTGVQAVADKTDMIKTGLLGKKLCFTETDFKTALGTSGFDSVTVTEIPPSTEGALMCNGRRVGEGKVIKRQMLSSLVFIPSSASVTESGFTFKVNGAGAGEEMKYFFKIMVIGSFSNKFTIG